LGTVIQSAFLAVPAPEGGRTPETGRAKPETDSAKPETDSAKKEQA
jgi:hypothetical protein